MTQSVSNKNLATALLGSQDEANAIDPELMLENGDFANELAASLSMDEALNVPAVEVGAEKALPNPTDLIKLPSAGQPESVNPKIFDPSLTQGVEKLIQPQTTQVDGLPAVDSEVTQAMLKTPQVQQAGRAPAIDFAKAEVDPQLMSMEDFVAQKNLAAKKSAHTSPYGINKSANQKVALENGLKPHQLVGEASASESGTSGSGMNSQQFILGLNVEQAPNQNQKLNEIQAPVKTFDMSQIKSSNSDQIMSQISDYIVQAKAAKEPTVNMRVNHDELGMIDITVQKGATNEAIAINIGAHSTDGKNFFQMNSKDLFSHLTNAGLNVSEIKVETPNQTAKNDFDFSGQSRSGFGSGDKQYNSESNQRRNESERRQDLWDLLKDKEAA
jgi:hypothetical protein